MDSLTQAALGAGVAAVCVPKGHRRKALLAGAMLGTLPDLDVFVDYGDPVANFTMHRGFSHSLFVLPAAGLAIWAMLRRFWRPVGEAPRGWLAAVLLALVTHPLLDAHTAYGTQLLWPLASPPVAWATLFIIDPLFTLPLVVGVIMILVRPQVRKGLAITLGLSAGYLVWSWGAKLVVEQHAGEAIAAAGIESRAVFAVPAPFTTLLWRYVALTDTGYVEGFDSLLLADDHLGVKRYPSDREALAALGDSAVVDRLDWFARGFISPGVEDGQLVITDLRMGQEPKYVFRFVVAGRQGGGWVAVTPVQLPTLVTREDVAAVWRRITIP